MLMNGLSNEDMPSKGKIRLLGALGRARFKASEALPIVEVLCQDEDPDVKRVAESVLEKIKPR